MEYMQPVTSINVLTLLTLPRNAATFVMTMALVQSLNKSLFPT